MGLAFYKPGSKVSLDSRSCPEKTSRWVWRSTSQAQRSVWILDLVLRRRHDGFGVLQARLKEQKCVWILQNKISTRVSKTSNPLRDPN
ncbi:hypothetical protein CEXT_587001 [Caerostris extrusa]|uniref:Uncharacterized protein n=1 Tax=Caerostris extrusa TaxID=172846 RepID=A0AAV4X0Y3_CAEEX|nr:hypothetical protein CEXT_587001 [Caerostris extrusa]